MELEITLEISRKIQGLMIICLSVQGMFIQYLTHKKKTLMDEVAHKAGQTNELKKKLFSEDLY